MRLRVKWPKASPRILKRWATAQSRSFPDEFLEISPDLPIRLENRVTDAKGNSIAVDFATVRKFDPVVLHRSTPEGEELLPADRDVVAEKDGD